MAVCIKKRLHLSMIAVSINHYVVKGMGIIMANPEKYNKILDALEELLKNKDITSISVSDIAVTAGIGKGSIYYYFSSKEEIWDALVSRNYEAPLQTAKNLAAQTSVPPFTRMAMLFAACRSASLELLKREFDNPASAGERALIHQKYIAHLVSELKPELTEIINQGIVSGEIQFDHPAALAEIVLIVLTVKLDNSLIPTSEEETENTLEGLVSLLEKVTNNPSGALNFLLS